MENSMDLPARRLDTLPFRVTRASHAILTVRDLDRSRSFYEEVIGLVLTHATPGTHYYRGIEEACHHSLVLHQSTAAPIARRIGFRMLTDADLDAGFRYFHELGAAPEWVEVPQQGRTFHTRDAVGVPLEFCAEMPVMPRMITRFETHRGGRAQRLDHFQLLTPHVSRAAFAYADFGFWLTEYIVSADGAMQGAFLMRKGNPHDVVFFHGDGPRLHHVAFFTREGQDLLTACNIAGSLGFGDHVERGPGLHGPGHATYVYIRDPDGHLIELFTTHYQIIDTEIAPVRWDLGDRFVAVPWGLPAQRKWFEQASAFADVPLEPAVPPPRPMTAERWLGLDST